MELSLYIVAFSAIALVVVAAVVLSKRVSRLKVSAPEAFEHILTVDDFEIFYQDSGRGPGLLFLHGIGASSFSWRFQLNEFSKTHRVVVPDLPGFGRSSKLTNKEYDLISQRDRLIEFIERVGLKKVVIVGSSMGALIALAIAEARPSWVEKLILLGPATEPQLAPKGLHQISWSAAFFKPWVGQKTIELIMKTVFVNPDVINKETIAKYSEPYQDTAAIQTFIKSLKTLRFKKTQQLLPKILAKSLILYGQKDASVPQWVVEKLARELPNSHLIMHPDLGHHLHEDNPTWTNAKISDFLNPNA